MLGDSGFPRAVCRRALVLADTVRRTFHPATRLDRHSPTALRRSTGVPLPDHVPGLVLAAGALLRRGDPPDGAGHRRRGLGDALAGRSFPPDAPWLQLALRTQATRRAHLRVHEQRVASLHRHICHPGRRQPELRYVLLQLTGIARLLPGQPGARVGQGRQECLHRRHHGVLRHPLAVPGPGQQVPGIRLPLPALP